MDDGLALVDLHALHDMGRRPQHRIGARIDEPPTHRDVFRTGCRGEVATCMHRDEHDIGEVARLRDRTSQRLRPLLQVGRREIGLTWGGSSCRSATLRGVHCKNRHDIRPRVPEDRRKRLPGVQAGADEADAGPRQPLLLVDQGLAAIVPAVIVRSDDGIDASVLQDAQHLRARMKVVRGFLALFHAHPAPPRHHTFQIDEGQIGRAHFNDIQRRRLEGRGSIVKSPSQIDIATPGDHRM